MSDTPVKQQSTAAFYGQAVASFAVAIAATAIGIVNLEADAWVRAFLGIAVLYLVHLRLRPRARSSATGRRPGSSSAGSTRPGWRSCSPPMTRSEKL
ncbi:hypothetical protein SFUMM280S_01475 [Streptomyces fumanus]